ncbi:MAG: TIGR02569 family protein [Sciscionella sp.]
MPPQAHVLAAFGIRGNEPVPASGGGWRCDDVLLRLTANPAVASWTARTLGELRVPDVRIARPVRSTDGRLVVGGWWATRFLAGEPQPHFDDTVSVAVKLNQATSELARPKFTEERAGVFAVADRMAWGELEAKLKPELGGRLFDVLAGSRRDVRAAPQLVHADLFGTLLFAEGEPPAVTDLVPYWRPAEWAAAVVVIDALAWGGADTEILRRWSHLPDWPQELLRALLFRLAGHALHPRSSEASLRGLEQAAHHVMPLL